VLPDGWVAKWSAVSDVNHTGPTLDEIVQYGKLLWYRTVWPVTEDNLEVRMDGVALSDLEPAKNKAKVMADISALFLPKPDPMPTSTK
jgi:hypothetical protein